MDQNEESEKIVSLNDVFLRSLQGGRVLMTAGVAALPLHDQFAIVARVRAFDDFTPDNDPYGEHDFGSFDLAGERIFWKIDCYAVDDMSAGSENPADPVQTTRVLTMMLALRLLRPCKFSNNAIR